MTNWVIHIELPILLISFHIILFILIKWWFSPLEYFWTAPELLSSNLLDDKQHHFHHPPSTPPGDIYSVGIILKEIFCRNGPYTEYDELSPKGLHLRLYYFIDMAQCWRFTANQGIYLIQVLQTSCCYLSGSIHWTICIYVQYKVLFYFYRSYYSGYTKAI